MRSTLTFWNVEQQTQLLNAFFGKRRNVAFTVDVVRQALQEHAASVWAGSIGSFRLAALRRGAALGRSFLAADERLTSATAAGRASVSREIQRMTRRLRMLKLSLNELKQQRELWSDYVKACVGGLSASMFVHRCRAAVRACLACAANKRR